MQNLGEAHQDYPVARLRIHPKNQQLLTIAADMDMVVLWGWNLRGEIRQLSTVGEGLRERPYTDAVYHPNGKWLILAGSGRPLEIRNIQDGTLVRRLGDEDEETSGYDCLGLSASGRVVMACSHRERSLDLYDLETGHCRKGIWQGRPMNVASLHPEGAVLAVYAEEPRAEVLFGTLTDLELSPIQRIIDTEPATSGMVFSPNGRLLAILSGEDDLTVAVREFPSLKLKFQTTIKREEGVAAASRPAERAVFSPDSLHLICPSPNGHLIELDTATGKELNRWHPHPQPVTSLDVHYRRGLLVSGCYDGQIKIWKFPYEGKLPSIRGSQVTRSFQALLGDLAAPTLEAVTS